MADSCPIPIKKQRTDNSQESSDSEDLNLSRAFDEDYQILMNEEILKICKQPSFLMENFEYNELLLDFIRRCDELLEWIENTTSKSRFKYQCRCDLYLDKYEKICCFKGLFESPRFTNINSLANMMISNKPHLANEIHHKLEELQDVRELKYLNFDIDSPSIVKDIRSDINDLQIWLKEIKERLSVQIDNQQVEYNESIENMLIDFKVHDDISNSITKTIEKVNELDSFMEYRETLLNCKTTLDELISQIHGQWLKAMELKYKLEFMPKFVMNFNSTSKSGISLVGPESGFESEISPMNPIRGVPTNNLKLMKYISSSGECFADNSTTDLPNDSESTDLPLDFTINTSSTRSISSSSSLVEIMLDLTHQSQISKEDLHSRKKQKRLKKRRQFASKTTGVHSENLTLEEREKYLQIRNAFYRPSYSLKRRISETSNIRISDRIDVTTNKISDLAAAAEKIVMQKDFNRHNVSLSESPKESEIEDRYGVVASSNNDLNVKDVWDNYQASLYSNDDGDSQILEVDKIKDWEQDLETDDQEYESCYHDKKLQFLTSGYETSMESDLHFCQKNLLSILKFSANQLVDVNQQIDNITKQWNSGHFSKIDKINSVINEQLSISNTHVKLLNQILNSDPCCGSNNENLKKDAHSLQDQWEILIKKFIFIQSKQERLANNHTLDSIIEGMDRIGYKISNLDLGNDLNSLKSTIDVLQEHKVELLNMNDKIMKIHSDGRYVLEEDIKNLSNRIVIMTDNIFLMLKSLNKDFEIMKNCMEKLNECQNDRVNYESEMKQFLQNNRTLHCENLSNNIFLGLENNKAILNKCMTYISDLSNGKYFDNMKFNFEQELCLIDELSMKLRFGLPVINNLGAHIDSSAFAANKPNRKVLPSFGGLLNRLPVQAAIVVFLAICGLWYKQSSYSCPGSSEWLKLIRKYTNSNMEPH